MILDKRVGIERKQFATQVCQLPEEIKVTLNDKFNGNESTEFYEGLLAGYACSYQILSLPKSKELIGTIVAYISEILEERS